MTDSAAKAILIGLTCLVGLGVGAGVAESTASPAPVPTPVSFSSTAKPQPKPSPTLSPHNRLAADKNFQAAGDQDCTDENSYYTAKKYHVGMWSFTGPDANGKVEIYCKGYYNKNGERFWWDVGTGQHIANHDELYVKP